MLFGLAGGGALVALASFWPSLHAVADPAALAKLQLAPFGDRVSGVAVFDAQGRRVPVTVRSGRVWPERALAPGAKLTIKATVRRASWIGWLVGRSERVQLVETAPEVRLAAQVVTVGPDGLVRLRFDAPVAHLAVAGAGTPRHQIDFAQPRTVVSTGIHASGTHRAGSLLVAAAPRAWESLPAPERVAFFPASPRVQALVTPAPAASLDPTQPIEIILSRPTAEVLGSAQPAIVPAIAGRWSSLDSYTLVFQPAGLGFKLGTHVQITLLRPVDVVAGSRIISRRTLSWQVPTPSTLRLQQLLAKLGYLPLTWRPQGADAPKTAAAQTQAAIHPLAGTFGWRYSNTPPQLAALWRQGRWTTMIQAAVMTFESEHGLAVDGIAGPKVWQALLADLLAGRRSNRGYSYVLVHRTVPQTLVLWHNGATLLQARVNTGVPAAPTPFGTHAVFEHHPSGTMSGVNPNGSHYHDPGIRWISYFNGGEAIHGFNRATYGFPQSVGCVEAPVATAARIWPYTPIGTLVTITQ